MQKLLDIISDEQFQPKNVAKTVYMLKKVDNELYHPLVCLFNLITCIYVYIAFEASALNNTVKWY